MLLMRIEAYLRRSGVPPTRFGREAMGDPRLVFDLRRGREPRPRTIVHLLRYMENRP